MMRLKLKKLKLKSKKQLKKSKKNKQNFQQNKKTMHILFQFWQIFKAKLQQLMSLLKKINQMLIWVMRLNKQRVLKVNWFWLKIITSVLKIWLTKQKLSLNAIKKIMPIASKEKKIFKQKEKKLLIQLKLRLKMLITPISKRFEVWTTSLMECVKLRH